MNKALLFLALCPAISYANMDQFIEDGDLNFTLRMDYIDLKSDTYGNAYIGYHDYDQSTWAMSAKAAYRSGYYNDHFGFDLDLYGVDPIGTQGEGFTTREIIKADSDGEAVGFVKAPQYVLKQKFMVDDFSVELFEGRRTLKEYGGTSIEQNAATSSYESITSEIKSDQWDVKLGYLISYSDSDETDNADFLTAEGETVDYIVTADGTYKMSNGDSVRYYITESQDYLRKQQLRYSYGFGPEALFGPGKITATLIYEDALSDYKAMSDSSRMFDDYAMMLALESDFYYQHGFMKLSYYYTQAEREGNLGKYEINMVNNAQGSQDILTSGNAYDYHDDGESMLGFLVIHHLNEAFTVGLDYRVGILEYEGETMTQDEITFIGGWESKSIPGLSISGVAAFDHSFKRGFDNTPYLVNGKHKNGYGRAYVAKIEYKF